MADRLYHYRPQTKFANVMFLHLSVSHSVQGGGACVAGGHAWQGACVAEGDMHGRGHVWNGCTWAGVCMAGGCAWQGVCMPPGHYEIRSVNARAVHILLECILVNENVHGNE